MKAIRMLVVLFALPIAACSSCLDSGDGWGFEEETGGEVARLDGGTEPDVGGAERREAVLVDTVHVGTGCCDDLDLSFETKEPRCFQVHVRCSYDPAYTEPVQPYPDVVVLATDCNLISVRTVDRRCSIEDVGEGEIVSDVRGTVRVEENFQAELDLSIRLEGEEDRRSLRQ